MLCQRGHAPGAGGVTPPETSHSLALGAKGSLGACGSGTQPLGSAHSSPAAQPITVTPSTAFNQLLQLVNFTQRPKEQITGRQECRLLQLVQRASGSQASWPREPSPAVGTCHTPQGDLVRRGLPCARAALCPWLPLAMPRCCPRRGEGPRQPFSWHNVKSPQANGRQWLWRRVCWRPGCHCSAFLCARGRHEHILTAAFRGGKGHEKFES